MTDGRLPTPSEGGHNGNKQDALDHACSFLGSGGPSITCERSPVALEEASYMNRSRAEPKSLPRIALQRHSRRGYWAVLRIVVGIETRQESFILRHQKGQSKEIMNRRRL
jgi:hypothetical protein